MKRSLIILCATVAIIFSILASDSYALNYEFRLEPNMMDLNHDYAYTWGIKEILEADQIISEASLTIYNLNNWRIEPNILYINLLKNAPLKVKKFKDNKDGNFFEHRGLLLDEYIDSSPAVEDYTYYFDESEILALTNALKNDKFGFGFDPDCHYYYSGVALQFQTEFIPEPTTLILLGSGLGGLAFFRRHKHTK